MISLFSRLRRLVSQALRSKEERAVDTAWAKMFAHADGFSVYENTLILESGAPGLRPLPEARKEES